MTVIEAEQTSGTKLDTILQLLKDAGVKARSYKRPPNPKEFFTMTIDTKDELLLHPGIADVKVIGDPKFKQAVIVVTEGKRTVTRTVEGRVYMPWDFRDKLRKAEREAKKNLKAGEKLEKPKPWTANSSAIRSMAIQNFPITIPGNPKFKVKVIKHEKPYPEADREAFTAEVTATVENETVTYFLVGLDEKKQFISQLPSAASSVEEAHKLLMPSGADAKGVVRQGEWFFKPVDAATEKALNELMAKRGGLPHVTPMERGSAHHGVRLTYQKKNYAKGFIVDRRTARHHVVFLTKWHEILRNAEVVPKPSERIRSRRWD